MIIDQTQNTPPPEGTGKESDQDVVILVPDETAPFGRRMFEKRTGKEIPLGQYPNIDWS